MTSLLDMHPTIYGVPYKKYVMAAFAAAIFIALFGILYDWEFSVNMIGALLSIVFALLLIYFGLSFFYKEDHVKIPFIVKRIRIHGLRCKSIRYTVDEDLFS